MDGLADLYSVGAVVYAMIAGKPPPATGKVPKPSSVYKKVPAEFDKVVMKLIAPKQEDRYQTAAELLDDMKPIGEENDLKL